jgi:plastocyanin
MKHSLPILAMLSTIGLAIACGSPSSPSTPTQAADVTITIQGDRGNQSFAPNAATMRVGQSVAWRNADTIAHNATQDANRFATSTLRAGETSPPLTMSTPGSYSYHCTIHPGMTGTFTVQ